MSSGRSRKMIGLALLAAWLGLTWWIFGAPALPPAETLAILTATALVALAIALWQQMRRATWRQVQGRHFVFRGHPLHVIEDADHQRWVRLADIRAIAGFTASDGALRLTYPNGWRLCGRPAQPHLSDEALLAHLSKERAPVAAKLRHWVERELVFPARRKREQRGIRLESLDFRASD